MRSPPSESFVMNIVSTGGGVYIASTKRVPLCVARVEQEAHPLQAAR